MKLLLLSEGDPESALSGSGTVRSVLTHLRAAKQDVVTGDAELYGISRAVAALTSFSPGRRRWAVKFRTGPLPFALRSRAASRATKAHRPPIDAILQYGSTFTPSGYGDIPYFLYMDSCMRIAAGSSQSWAGSLTSREVTDVITREQRAYDRAATIFAFSEAVRRAFISQVGLPADRVVTTYAGPNLDLDQIPDRSHTGSVGHPPTILFVGREFERKGGDVLLRAFARVRAKLPTAQLMVVGPAAQIDQAGVTNLGLLRKDRPAELHRMVEAYRSADAFCFPTRYEPFGIVILEAMVFGLPCVATRTGAIPEMVVENETGFLVAPDDVDGLSTHLLTVLTNPELAARFRLQAQKRAEEHFTWPAVVSKMLSVISTHLESRGAVQSGGREK